MLNLLPLVLGGLVIFGIAKYNKSNKLFWQLMMAFLFGVMCGSVGRKLKTFESSKKNGISYVIPMQSSSALTICNELTLDEALTDAALQKEAFVCINTLSAGLVNTDRDIIPPTRTRTVTNPDSDVGYKLKFFNTS